MTLVLRGLGQQLNYHKPVMLFWAASAKHENRYWAGSQQSCGCAAHDELADAGVPICAHHQQANHMLFQVARQACLGLSRYDCNAHVESGCTQKCTRPGQVVMPRLGLFPRHHHMASQTLKQRAARHGFDQISARRAAVKGDGKTLGLLAIGRGHQHRALHRTDGVLDVRVQMQFCAWFGRVVLSEYEQPAFGLKVHQRFNQASVALLAFYRSQASLWGTTYQSVELLASMLLRQLAALFIQRTQLL